MRLLFCLIAILLAPALAEAATVQATPATLAAKVASARPGDTIRLSRGTYVDPVLRRIADRVTLDAREAEIVRMTVHGASGLKIVGGTWRTGCPTVTALPARWCDGMALRLLETRNVTVSGAAFHGPPAGIAHGSGIFVLRGGGVDVTDTSFRGLAKGIRFRLIDGFSAKRINCAAQRVDCITIAQSWNGLIEDVTCRETKISSNEHPDCIQAWSRADAKPTGNIVLRRIKAYDDTQGIGFFNHLRLYRAGTRLADGTVLKADTRVDDGGYGRIVVEDSEIVVTRPNGITIRGARELVLRNNRVVSAPGSRRKAKIVTGGSVEVQRCGNSVGAFERKPAIKERPC